MQRRRRLKMGRGLNYGMDLFVGKISARGEDGVRGFVHGEGGGLFDGWEGERRGWDKMVVNGSKDGGRATAEMTGTRGE